MTKLLFFTNAKNGNLQHDFILPTHSRTSSSASSVGSSYVSSTDSTKTSLTESPTPTQASANAFEATNNFLNSNYHSANGMATLPRYQNTYNTLINELNDMNEHLSNENANYDHSLANSHDGTDSQSDKSSDDRLDRDDLDSKNDSIFGSIRSIDVPSLNNEGFTYRTLNGGVIRSVHPPGKGNSTAYKVSEG